MQWQCLDEACDIRCLVLPVGVECDDIVGALPQGELNPGLQRGALS